MSLNLNMLKKGEKTMTTERAVATLCRGIFNTSNLVPGMDISDVSVMKVEGRPQPNQEQSSGRGVHVQFTIGWTPLGKAEIEDGAEVYAALGLDDKPDEEGG